MIWAIILGSLCKRIDSSTGEPRLARELCPKKPRANQNRTNQGSILLYTHQN